MVTHLYTTGQFAAMAGVTIRTLRFYDRLGLLRPSSVTEAGHRRYTEPDLIRLQQILALKSLGFSLEEIREMVGTGSLPLQDTLSIQKQALEERRAEVDQAIQSIESLRHAVAAGWEPDWELLIRVIKVTQMEQDKDRWKQYYGEEARRKIEERAKGYSQEQAWADAKRWEEVIGGMKAAAARGEDPASPEVQELAERWIGLVHEFTMGDREIQEGLARSYQDPNSPWPKPYSDEEGTYIERALEIYRGKQRPQGA